MKKILALVLAGLMMVSFAGCGSSSSSGSADRSAAETSAEESASEEKETNETQKAQEQKTEEEEWLLTSSSEYYILESNPDGKSDFRESFNYYYSDGTKMMECEYSILNIMHLTLYVVETGKYESEGEQVDTKTINKYSVSFFQLENGEAVSDVYTGDKSGFDILEDVSEFSLIGTEYYEYNTNGDLMYKRGETTTGSTTEYTYTYDTNGNLLTETEDNGSVITVTTYDYENGVLVKKSAEGDNGFSSEYIYDKEGNLLERYSWGNLVEQIEYENGKKKSSWWRFFNGETEHIYEYEYDSEERIIQLNVSSVYSSGEETSSQTSYKYKDDGYSFIATNDSSQADYDYKADGHSYIKTESYIGGREDSFGIIAIGEVTEKNYIPISECSEQQSAVFTVYKCEDTEEGIYLYRLPIDDCYFAYAYGAQYAGWYYVKSGVFYYGEDFTYANDSFVFDGDDIVDSYVNIDGEVESRRYKKVEE